MEAAALSWAVHTHRTILSFLAYTTYSVARQKTTKAATTPDSPSNSSASSGAAPATNAATDPKAADKMENLKRAVGDAGTFLTRAVQVSFGSFSSTRKSKTTLLEAWKMFDYQQTMYENRITQCMLRFDELSYGKSKWLVVEVDKYCNEIYVENYQDAHISDEAGTMFNRAKQFTEERLGKAERTENDAAFESLSKRTDKIKGYTEKLVKNSEAVLVPNPAARLETFMFDTLPVDKIGVTNTRLTNLEYLGADMIEAGNEFGTGTPYGSALIRVGQTEQALGEIEREYIKNSHSAFIGPLGTFLEVHF